MSRKEDEEKKTKLCLPKVIDIENTYVFVWGKFILITADVRHHSKDSEPPTQGSLCWRYVTEL